MARIQATKKNLTSPIVTKPLMQWLIAAAKARTTISYGAAKIRLENEFGFSTINPRFMGAPCGAVMEEILEYFPRAPLLNVLMVRAADGYAGPGAGGFMDYRFKDPRLSDYDNRNKPYWRKAAERAVEEVYEYGDKWDNVFKTIYGKKWTPSPWQGSEKDGSGHGGRGGSGGEGPKHKALRLWVNNNPHKINPQYRGYQAKTEYELESADRVDVALFGPNCSIAIEVKSAISNYPDLRRGIFQCIKYRAVLEAMDTRKKPKKVEAVLVTQEPLPGDLQTIVRQKRIKHFLAPPNIKAK